MSRGHTANANMVSISHPSPDAHDQRDVPTAKWMKRRMMTGAKSSEDTPALRAGLWEGGGVRNEPAR